jgi:hypothetical protein
VERKNVGRDSGLEQAHGSFSGVVSQAVAKKQPFTKRLDSRAHAEIARKKNYPTLIEEGIRVHINLETQQHNRFSSKGGALLPHLKTTYELA